EHTATSLRNLELGAVRIDDPDRADDLVRAVRANGDRRISHLATVAEPGPTTRATPRGPAGGGGLHSPDRESPDLLRHALRVVAAARGEHARRRNRRRAPTARSRGDGARAVLARAGPARRAPRPPARGMGGGHSDRALDPDLEADAHRRARRRPGESLAGPPQRSLRRRPRRGAGLAEPVLPRAHLRRRAHRGNVLLAGAARLPDSEIEKGSAAHQSRRAAR